MQDTVIIVCGPTSSGKSDFAHELAKSINGEIINADSTQVYQEFPIITSSPSEEFRENIPYHLFNFLHIGDNFSAFEYVVKAKKTIKDILSNRATPILVGGSGLYIDMLINGYHYIPHIDKMLYNELANKRASIGNDLFYSELLSLDNKVRDKIASEDTYRVIRAYAIYKTTGKSYFDYISEDKIYPLKDLKKIIISMNPSKDLLYKRCNNRIREIITSYTAINEVKKVIGMKVIDTVKIIPLQEILSFIKNQINMDELIELSSKKVRNYAKRQITWFKNQIAPDIKISFSTDDEFSTTSKKYINALSQNNFSEKAEF